MVGAIATRIGKQSFETMGSLARGRLFDRLCQETGLTQGSLGEWCLRFEAVVPNSRIVQRL